MGQYVFGVDVGGTTVKLGLFNAEGVVLDKWEIKTNKENSGEAILSDIVSAINAKTEEKGIAKSEVLGVGVGVPGPVDSKGIVHRCVNLGWDEFNVNDKLGELVTVTVQVSNEESITITYSPLTYAYLALQSDDTDDEAEKLICLMKAMYDYWEAADDYID